MSLTKMRSSPTPVFLLCFALRARWQSPCDKYLRSTLLQTIRATPFALLKMIVDVAGEVRGEHLWKMFRMIPQRQPASPSFEEAGDLLVLLSSVSEAYSKRLRGELYCSANVHLSFHGALPDRCVAHPLLQSSRMSKTVSTHVN